MAERKNLFERAQQEGTPLIDGDRATFVWSGAEPPELVGDFCDWEPECALKLKRISKKVWAASLQLPEDAYVEYAYIKEDERVPDPFNNQVTPNGIGKYNHAFYMPAGKPTQLIKRKRNVPSGEVFSVTIEGEGLVVGGRRKVHFYQPPVEQPVPLVVVYDGREYLQRAHLPRIVDNLIAQKRIQPFALAMIENHPKARFIEYSCSESALAFIVEWVLPRANNEIDLIDISAAPGAYGILGASMGGLMSLYTALRLPHIFGRVLSQSGAFSLDGVDMVVYPLVRYLPAAFPLKIWMDVGSMEWLLETNRRMFALLREKGYDASLHEYSGGHNYPAWRNDVSRGFESLFPYQPEESV